MMTNLAVAFASLSLVTNAIGTVDTVNKANMYDYSQTISESGERLSASAINDKVRAYGSFGNTQGMPVSEYMDAMSYEWIEVSDLLPKDKSDQKADIDLKKQYTYEELVQIQLMLANSHEGIHLYNIGKSTAGAPMYALDIDMTECAEEDKHIVLLTGQVHARESAGPTYILKELIDLVNDYDNGVERAVKALYNTRFVAVACVNPDGHDGIGFDVKNWTYKDGLLWKATSNGTDLNRNFPGLSWMQLKKGVKATQYKSSTPDKIYYWGDYAGSCNETKAMMKFYQYFVGVEGAEMLIDYHQQGRITYAGKGYAPSDNNKLSEELRKACYAAQTKGSLKSHYAYCYDDTEENYGLEGTGSTNTDYAWAVAMGAQFSTQYGFSVHVDSEGNEYPLIMIPEYDKADVELRQMRSPEFRTLSWEIGSGRSYLGYTKDTLKLLEKEYYNYNFDEMLYTYVDVLNR